MIGRQTLPKKGRGIYCLVKKDSFSRSTFFANFVTYVAKKEPNTDISTVQDICEKFDYTLP